MAFSAAGRKGGIKRENLAGAPSEKTLLVRRGRRKRRRRQTTTNARSAGDDGASFGGWVPVQGSRLLVEGMIVAL